MNRPTPFGSLASASIPCRTRSRNWPQLGLLERLDAVGIRTYELFYTNRFGQEIWREPRGTDAGYDVPQFSIHRGKLQSVIYQAVAGAAWANPGFTPATVLARTRRTTAA